MANNPGTICPRCLQVGHVQASCTADRQVPYAKLLPIVELPDLAHAKKRTDKCVTDILAGSTPSAIPSPFPRLGATALMLAILLHMDLEGLERHVKMLKKARRRIVIYSLNCKNGHIPRKTAFAAAQDMLAVRQWEKYG